MVGTAAADQENLADASDQILGEPCRREIHRAVLPENRVDGVPHRLGLFVDLLHHEVLETALLGSLLVHLHFHRALFDDVLINVVKGHIAARELSDLIVSNIIDIPSIFKEGRHIGSHIGLFPVHPDDQRGILSGHIEFVRAVLEQHRQGIGAPDAHHGAGEGIHRSLFVFFQIIIDQVDGYLGVRLRVEGVSVPGKLVFQLLVIFDDAVVHAHNRAVLRDMRVRVGLRGLAVCGPAGMADSNCALQRETVVRLLLQRPEPPLGLDNDNLILIVPHGKAG